MYPVLFRIGEFEITSFGVMVALAAVAGVWLFDRERRRSGLPDHAVDAAMAGVFGGVAGAKVVWAIEHVGREGPFLDLLLSRGGLSWFGGFAGGVVAGIVVLRWRRIPILPVLAAATPALAVAHAIGRVGCFLVGDDYGIPSSLPWAMAFPEGLPPTAIPVHPTQLYEMAALLPLAWLLMRWRRAGKSDRFVLGAYLAAAGLIRFGIEFLRLRQPLFGPLAVAHVLSLAVALAGFALLYLSRADPPNREAQR
ncbi:MAG: prolipoprotein diacylglyceryl transferase family protein [Acidobacteriota bacterium]